MAVGILIEVDNLIEEADTAEKSIGMEGNSGRLVATVAMGNLGHPMRGEIEVEYA